MLPSCFRITIPLFNQNRNKSFVYRSPFFTVLIKRGREKQRCPRFVIFVPKTLDKRSTKRNWTRRIMSEFLFTPIKQEKRPSVDISIRMKVLVTDENRQKIQDEVEKLFVVPSEDPK